MKTLFLLVVALLLSFVPLWAQPDTNAIPKLEEICTVKAAIEKPSFYPDLGAKGSVIGLTTLDHVYDLSNPCALPFSKLFPCASSIAPRAGDFNGDGNVDYWMSGCGIVRGTGKGMLPRIDSIAPTYEYHNMSEGREVWDIDNDGNDDLSELGYYADAEPQRIIFGGKDLWNLESVSFPTTFGKVMEVYTRSDGSARALCSQRYDKKTDFPKRQIITLARLIVERQGEKRVIRLEKLSEFTYTEQSGGELSGYSELPGYMYHSQRTDEHTWLGGIALTYYIFDLRSDTFRLVRTGLPTGESNPRFLHRSIDGDSKEDWIVQFPLSKVPATLYYSGNPADTLLPIGWTKQKIAWGYTPFAVNDVTGDNIGDIGISVFDELNEVVFYKGRQVITSVEEVLSADKTLRLSPQPVSASGICRIDLTTVTGTLQEVGIYTVNGKLVGAIHTEVDARSASFTPSLLGIKAGIHLLRAKVGKSIYETRLVIIE